MELDYNEIGNRIRKLRKDKKFTQKDLAKATGLTIGHISHLETGSNRPTLDTIAQICTILDVSSDEIIFGEKKAPGVTPPPPSPFDLILSDCPKDDQQIIIEVSATLKKELQIARLRAIQRK